MGLGGISPWSLVLILVIVLLLFGTKKLRNLGSDLGGAFKGFKNAMSDEQASEEDKKLSSEEGENSEETADTEAKKDSAESK